MNKFLIFFLEITVLGIIFVSCKSLTFNFSPANTFPISEEYSGQREKYDWYSSLGSIRTMTIDDTPAVVTVEVLLGYKKDDKDVSVEITSKSKELVNLLK